MNTGFSASRPMFIIRAVLSRGGKALDLTEDHKPNAPREMERIYRCGILTAHTLAAYELLVPPAG